MSVVVAAYVGVFLCLFIYFFHPFIFFLLPASVLVDVDVDVVVVVVVVMGRTARLWKLKQRISYTFFILNWGFFLSFCLSFLHALAEMTMHGVCTRNSSGTK